MIYYILFSQVAIVFFWLVYDLLLRWETFHRIKRSYIWISLAAAFLYPLIDWASTVPVSEELVFTLPTFYLAADAPLASTTFDWGLVLFIGYVAGAIGTLIYQLLGVFKLMRWKSNAQPMQHLGKHIFASPIDSSFSLFQWIFISTKLSSEEQKVIIDHERTHQKYGHSFDLLALAFLKVLFWFNPAVWFLKKRLQEVHEFQVDAEMLKQNKKQTYQELLVAKALGVSAHVLAHHFINKSLLKKRIDMMNRTISSKKSLLKFSALIPVSAALIFIASCAKEAGDQESTNQPIQKVQEANAPNEKPYDEPPQFTGGQDALFDYLMNNLEYPEEAKSEGVEGRAFVQFTIAESGNIEAVNLLKSSKNVFLDDEAIRAVNAMPKWTPATKNGQAVSMKMTLPIDFRLSKDEKEKVEQE